MTGTTAVGTRHSGDDQALVAPSIQSAWSGSDQVISGSLKPVCAGSGSALPTSVLRGQEWWILAARGECDPSSLRTFDGTMCARLTVDSQG